MDFALEHVRNLASLHQNEFVKKMCDIFAAENGKEASTAELYEMIGAIKQGFADEAAEEAEESVSEVESEVSGSASDADSGDFDEEALDEEMEVALKHVRDLGAIHQNEFVNTICDLYAEEYGAEPSTEELYDLFSDIQQVFAAEADEEESTASDSETDGDYDPEEDDIGSSEVQIQ